MGGLKKSLLLLGRGGGGIHIGRAVRFVGFIAIFSTNIAYSSYKSSHLSLLIFVTAKFCLYQNLVKIGKV